MRLLLLLVPFLLAAQTETTYEGLPAIDLANNRITLTVTIRGGVMTHLVLNDDAEKMSPLWEPIRMARENGREQSATMLGHFPCVDGFGQASPEENEAGMPFHGEAYLKDLEVLESGKSGDTTTLRMRAELPIVHEVFTRTYRIVDGEQVIYVDSEVESQLGFDRPLVWGEHATISSPFLAPEVTVVDLSAARSQVRPRPGPSRGRHRLDAGKDFTWPMAPGAEGGLVDIRSAPANPGSMDHTTNLLDPNRRLQFVTALNLEKRLLLGYVFRTEDFPWVQTWESYMSSSSLTRGLEFSTQPYDVPRRESIGLGKMFDTPTFRWLFANSKVATSFVMFYTRVPEGFLKVDNVEMRDGQIILEDWGADKTVTLSAQRPL